ncbi:MAG: hypothetical protein P1U56_07700 [Saprospiraceae bacterium]|nr:hypothetical protein [Saprospiraceae bacterium]
MKSLKFFFIGILGITLLSSCLKDECNSTQGIYTYEPVYMTKEEINSQSITSESSAPLKNPGKIYYQGDVLFISEVGEGVHIFDNSDKSNPVPISFLKIPGNVDVSFKGSHLIADSYLNILIIDISDINNPVVESRIEDIKTDYYYYDEEKEAYIIDYIGSTKPITLECDHPFFERTTDYYFYDDFGFMSFNGNIDAEASVFASDVFFNSQGNSPGIAGSLSSFALVGDHFYFITGPDVNVYDISNISNPIFTDGFDVAWNIETLFPYQDKLFIGGQNGMYIYDNSDPSSPRYLSEFVHARACDPVFVEGTTAYVTLSEGNRCSNFTNQLDVIDVTDILDPTLIKSYSMYRPKGLSVYNSTLFLADDKAGIKIFDVTDKEAVSENKLGSIRGETFFEVIHMSPTEIMAIGPDGIFQYDVSTVGAPSLLSHIEVVK